MQFIDSYASFFCHLIL